MEAIGISWNFLQLLHLREDEAASQPLESLESGTELNHKHFISTLMRWEVTSHAGQPEPWYSWVLPMSFELNPQSLCPIHLHHVQLDTQVKSKSNSEYWTSTSFTYVLWLFHSVHNRPECLFRRFSRLFGPRSRPRASLGDPKTCRGAGRTPRAVRGAGATGANSHGRRGVRCCGGAMVWVWNDPRLKTFKLAG